MEMKNVRLGVLVPGCAEHRDGGIAVTSRVGPLVEMLAELVGHTTVLGYEPPPTNPAIEDRTDYVMRPAGGRIDFVSLGPKGSYGDYLARRARVWRITRKVSGQWDLVFLPLTNRRVGLVFGALRCQRIVAQIGGHTPNVARVRNLSATTKALALITSNLTARVYRKIARASVFVVNGEALLPIYEPVQPAVKVVRTSARRAAFQFQADDRFGDDAPRIGIVSRLTPPKGVLEVVEAFALVRQRSLPGATLHVVGEGDAEPAMRELAQGLGVADAVTWYGWVPPGAELFDVFRTFDVLVTLSLAESLPNTVWEALAHSVLVIATPVGALPLAFTDAEELLFVPVKKPEAAAEAIERLAHDSVLRRRLLDRGRAVSEAASVESVASRLLELAAGRWPELLQDRIGERAERDG